MKTTIRAARSRLARALPLRERRRPLRCAEALRGRTAAYGRPVSRRADRV
ncbi:hypothetical protein ACWD1Y_11530 [Streptomyces sp. NPDC002814]